MDARLSGLKSRCLGNNQGRRAVWVAYGVEAQDFGCSSMQLWRKWDFCESGSKCAVRRLVTTLDRTRFCSSCVGFCLAPTRRRGWVDTVSAGQTRHAGSTLSSASLSFFLRGLVTKVRLRTPTPNVYSAAECLALLRCEWWCRDSVEVRGSNPWGNSRG